MIFHRIIYLKQEYKVPFKVFITYLQFIESIKNYLTYLNHSNHMCLCMNIYIYIYKYTAKSLLTYVGIIYCIFIIPEKLRKQNDYEFIYLANKNIL